MWGPCFVSFFIQKLWKTDSKEEFLQKTAALCLPLFLCHVKGAVQLMDNRLTSV